MGLSDNILSWAGRRKTSATQIYTKEAVKHPIVMPLMNRLVVLTLLLASVSCSSFADVKITKAIESGQFHVGMTLDEVCNIIGRRPSATVDLVTINEDSSGRMMTWVIGIDLAPGVPLVPVAFAQMSPNSYTLMFRNDRLVSWGKQLSNFP